MPRSTAGSGLAVPHAAVVLLLIANAAAYGLCLWMGGAPEIPKPVLIAAGALTPAALQPGEAWRLFVAGFLHADPVHLLGNMLSLVIVGPAVERRLGLTAFALVYAASLAGAGAMSVLLHQGPFVGVGASGAVFGLMGALLALWGLGDAEVPPSFFLVNFALNAALSARDPRVDWAAHAGGLVSGMAAVALLDAAARANALWLRCRFPEFASAGAALVMAAGGATLWVHPPAFLPGLDPRLAALIASVGAALALVKLLDLLLSARRGLAGVVLVFAVAAAAAAWGAGTLAAPALARACAAIGIFGAPDGAAALVCPDVALLPPAAAGAAGLLVLLALAAPLRRGLGDVGFVGATFVGDRRRERGLVRPTRHTRA